MENTFNETVTFFLRLNTVSLLFRGTEENMKSLGVATVIRLLET
jgi:hypothetical protein